LSQAIKTNAGEAERSLTQLASSTTIAIRSSAQDAERSMTGMSTGVSNVLKQNANEVERTLLGVSAEVARNFVGRAEELTHALSQRAAEMTRILDEKSSGLLSALDGKSQEFAGEVSRVTDHAVKAIEAKGFTFTQTMMDNSEYIARLINESSESATNALSRSIKELHTGAQQATEGSTSAIARVTKDLQESTEMAAKNAATVVSRTLRDLQEQTHAAVEQSKQTASAAVSEMLETHGMLRSDTTALFERLREANILLQEVLSGAHENMGEIETTLITRVADFVTAMNDIGHKTGESNTLIEQNIVQFQSLAAQTLNELSQLATQFDTHGASLAEAVALIDRSNRRTEGTLTERRESLEALVHILDNKGEELDHRVTHFTGVLDKSLGTMTRALETRAEDLDDRLTRFSSLLDQSLEGATERTREIARLVAETTNQGSRAIAENFETIRTTNEEEYKRTSEAMRTIYEQNTQQSEAMLAHAATRFTEVVEELKGMTSEMQRELDATRSELRKGILQMPQETADSTAQMRRVIVDQIEALAELNRIVARHGRNLDAAEPATRRAETVETGSRRAVAREERPIIREERPALRDDRYALPEDRPPVRDDRVAAREERPSLRDDRMPIYEEPHTYTNGNGATKPQEPRPQLADIADVAPPPPTPPARRTPAPALSPAGQVGTAAPGRTGWLSDLLTRASPDDEVTPARETPSVRERPRGASTDSGATGDDRAARHSIESLDSLAVDIARMIDHDAAAELWDRYKRGERNVFTRKLYTMQGQRAFEEIRRKYRSDREFQATVDRYVAEFERLLDEVSKDDRGQVVARTYLTSETGKVYTMLAHAAGRLDG